MWLSLSHFLQEEPVSDTPVTYDTGPLVLVVLLLVLLGFLFWLMLKYSHRIEQSSYLGSQFQGALYTIERQRRLIAATERWERGEYHREVVGKNEWLDNHPLPTPPENVKSDFVIREARRNLLETGRIGPRPPPAWAGESEDEAEVERYLDDLRIWESEILAPEARTRFEQDIGTKEKEAYDAAKSALGTFDLAALRGRGPEFVLQFTAVVTIIFATFGLGALQRLSSEQAGTILAAIAGYVLGQATSRPQSASDAPPEPPAKSPAPEGLPADEQG